MQPATREIYTYRHTLSLPDALPSSGLEAEAAAGMPEIEACSFVPPKLIPQFSDCLEVLEPALKLDGVLISALIPNLKGAERGIAAGVPKMNYVTSVSEKHNLANVRRTPAESVDDRSEERRVRKGCVRTCRSWWSPDH